MGDILNKGKRDLIKATIVLLAEMHLREFVDAMLMLADEANVSYDAPYKEALKEILGHALSKEDTDGNHE